MWERSFARVHTGPDFHADSFAIGTGSFQGLMRLVCGADNPENTRAELTELKRYTYISPVGLRSRLGAKFTLIR
jgi:hypothetical protein